MPYSIRTDRWPLDSSTDLDAFLRNRLAELLGVLLEAELDTWLGRTPYAREAGHDLREWRNGYGKPCRIPTTLGPITLRRPRIRGLGDRFESKVLSLFRWRSRQLGTALPRLLSEGMVAGDMGGLLQAIFGQDIDISMASLAGLESRWNSERYGWRTLETLPKPAKTAFSQANLPGQPPCPIGLGARRGSGVSHSEGNR